jgi:hypothetical protein
MTKPALKITAAALHAEKAKKRDGPMCEKCSNLDARRRGPAGCLKGYKVLTAVKCADYKDTSAIRHEAGGLLSRRSLQ